MALHMSTHTHHPLNLPEGHLESSLTEYGVLHKCMELLSKEMESRVTVQSCGHDLP